MPRGKGDFLRRCFPAMPRRRKSDSPPFPSSSPAGKFKADAGKLLKEYLEGVFYCSVVSVERLDGKEDSYFSAGSNVSEDSVDSKDSEDSEAPPARGAFLLALLKVSISSRVRCLAPSSSSSFAVLSWLP